jgi:hypothetical protein
MTTPDNAAATEAAQRATQPARAPKTFAQTLQDINFGHFADECTDALREAIDASERTNKVTEVTVKLKIKPVGKNGSGRYEVHPDVSAKLPPKDRETAMMFVGPDGNLTNRDPRQQEIPGIRAVDGSSEQRAVRLEEQQQPTVRVG